MQNLQSSIINQYQERYPNHTLKQISQTTGIQITRVFRILNGYDMKLSEYQLFEEAVHGSADKRNVFFKLSNLCQTNLSQKKIDQIESFMKHHLNVLNYKSSSVSPDTNLELA
tara:strand:- start:21 stop:359 length:339 start_codon:yes stop_codon:yes gene_type:complete